MAEGGTIFAGGDFECPLILCGAEMVDLNALDGAFGVGVDMDRDKKIRILCISEFGTVLEFDEFVSFTGHEDADSRLPA
ncbi:MAG: hypothetical protein JW394_0245 [Nitrospira sp.]|nr:hypothetical protein [Nitrospira sp.]